MSVDVYFFISLGMSVNTALPLIALLPYELWHYIRSLWAMLPLYEQWVTIVAELRAQWRHEICGWPHHEVPWTPDDLIDRHKSCWITAITHVYWNGNRIAALQYGDHALHVVRYKVCPPDTVSVMFDVYVDQFCRVYIISSDDDDGAGGETSLANSIQHVKYCERLMRKLGGPIAILTIQAEKLKSRQLDSDANSGTAL